MVEYIFSFNSCSCDRVWEWCNSCADRYLAQRMQELEELHAQDERTPEGWSEQKCLCGNDGWCGRDSHRPDFAVDEDGSTIF